MGATEAPKKEKKAWPAVVGWGSLFIFSIVFVWMVKGQLGENFAKREHEALQMVKDYKPDGDMTMSDLTKNYSILAKEKGAYVGEFTWDAKQKDGAHYEVTLLWKEGEAHRVAVWVVDLSSKEIRPQGDEAASLPRRAKAGGGA